MEHGRLTALAGLYITGALNATEQNELHSILLSCPAARELFDRIIITHNSENPVQLVATATEFLETYVPVGDVITLSAEPPTQTFDLMSMFRASVRSWRHWSVGGALAACSIAALIIAVQPPTRPFKAPARIATGPVATLRHAAGVEWLGQTNNLFIGDSFPAGELSIARGSYELEFTRGARLVVEGPARLQLVSDNEAFLHSGKVTAHVPDTAHGFRVIAPRVSVTDLGTEFGLHAPSNAPAEVHVFSGLVDMAPASKTPRKVTQGHAARIGRTVRKLSAKRDIFPSTDALIEMETEEYQDRYNRWKTSAQALSSDPATLIHYTFQDQPETDVELTNQAVNAPRGSTAAITGTWGTGRWPGKAGFSFASKADRIRFQVPNTLTSLTYMAWVRVDKLTSVSNALAITEGNQLGEVHWQMYRDGRVALSARSGKKGDVDETWDRGLSPTIFTTNQLGKWVHLTSVYDSESRAINHYVNGRIISSTPIKRLVPLKLNAVEIGNWGVRADEPKWAHLKSAGPNYLNRHWTGCIDEFALLARAMRPDEIQEYYARGRASVGVVLAQAGEN